MVALFVGGYKKGGRPGYYSLSLSLSFSLQEVFVVLGNPLCKFLVDATAERFGRLDDFHDDAAIAHMYIL